MLTTYVLAQMDRAVVVGTLPARTKAIETVRELGPRILELIEKGQRYEALEH